MSRRVYFAVFGSGLGHVTRVLDIARRVKGDGYQVRFSSFGQGLAYLRANGEEASADESPALDVEWSSGGFSSRHVLPHFPFMFNKFLRQLAFEQANIKRFDPDLVVSDSRLSAVLASRMISSPVVTILNQFSVAFPPRFRGRVGRVYEMTAGDGLGLMWSLSEKVLMTDLPPPYTIGEANLVSSHMARIVEFIGFTAPSMNVTEEAARKTKSALGIDGRPLVFCQVSGPDATKGRFAQTIIEATASLAREHNVVISLGYPEGSREPRKLATGAWIYEWCPVKDELFSLSRVLVARAGHSTIGQCIEKGKPAVLVPIHNHPEQLGNAEKFRRLGLGVDIRSERLTPQSLTEAVETCLKGESYQRRVAAVSEVSKRYRGVERCAEVVESLA